MNHSLKVCMKMENIIFLFLLCSSFCSFAQSNGAGEPLDFILHEHGLRALLFRRQPHETGILYEVKLPASLSGMYVSYVRLRSKTLWREGANFSNFLIPSKTLPVPYVKRMVIVYQDLGNLSYHHTVPGYTLVSTVVGFIVYDATNPTTTNARKLDFNASISLHFSNMKFPRGAKCASFGGSYGEVSVGDMSVGNVCQTRSYGWFSVVVPKRKKGRVKVRWGVGVGLVIVMVLLVSFVVKIMRVRRLDETEMQNEDGSGDLETIWIGYNKMPCATVIRTHPNLDKAGLPS